MDQEITYTCVTYVGNNGWMREGFFAVGGGMGDGDMVQQMRFWEEQD